MSAALSLRRRGPSGRLTPYGLIAPGVTILILLFAVPAAYNIWLSLHDVTPYDALGDGQFVGAGNFRSVLKNPLTLSSLKNTVLWLTLVTVAIRLVLGLGIALLLQASVLRRLRLVGLTRTLVLIPWMIPPTVAVAAWRWLLDGQAGLLNQLLMRFGLIDQGVPFLGQTSTVWWCIVAIISWRELPFVIIVLMAGLQAIPHDQYEAAAIDGAGRLRSLLYVTLPNLRPVLGVVALMITINSFNNFVYVWLTTGGGPGTYTQVLATQLFSAAFVDNQLGSGAAIGLLMSACMVVFSLVYLGVLQRRARA
ncbi:carbohydrate ABC transporter membrane protein 1 (CUT1 family) [Kribbella sp. VKM Ac-2569]|uniref:carbohydrate ABC transporter permease n=1 Tax=Kribbella sp. VKM Ac-2569 TaxID=2512220 RepID=UPI0010F42AFB|nr:sugar ABC transporter permease [Kribbella sp. VKM Ac-2569]RZT17035.1 carbohydrate ABC transporter membrane protein 1 (CUT1 family) [Kribbella sp. VKM Ac-2569]